jgi:hypothetical protein
MWSYLFTSLNQTYIWFQDNLSAAFHRICTRQSSNHCLNLTRKEAFEYFAANFLLLQTNLSNEKAGLIPLMIDMKRTPISKVCMSAYDSLEVMKHHLATS